MLRRVVVGVVAALALSGCTSSSSDPGDAPTSTPTSSSPTTTTPPDPGPTPRVGECHDLSFRQAISVVGRTEPVRCRTRHTAQTFHVGRLELATKYLAAELMFDDRRVWLSRSGKRTQDYRSTANWAETKEEP